MSPTQPVFNAPRVVLLTLGVMAAVHAARSLMSEQLETWVVVAGAFIPSRYTGEDVPGGEVAKYSSFVTHMFLHGDLMHLAINSGWLLAFGTMVARRLPTLRFLGLFLITGIAGAALFLACNWGLAQPMIGASGAISGLMGAAVRFIFVPSDSGGAAPSMTLAELARDRRARVMVISWLALNLLFGLVLGNLFSEGGIAWEAHLGGFLTGLLLLPVFERGVDATPDSVRPN